METTAPRLSTGRSRLRWWLVGLVLALAGGAVAYVLLTRPTAATTTAVQSPQTLPIVLRPHAVTVAGPGTLEASTSLNLTVAAGLSGRIAAIASVGDRVSAGDQLASLDPTAFERSLKLAQFDLERVQAQLRSLESSQAQAQASAAQQRASAEATLATAQRTAETKAEDLALVQNLRGLGAESDEALRNAQVANTDASQAAATAASDLEALKNTLALQAAARQNDLTNSQLSVAQAELDVEEAEADLASLTVSAPFGGVVSQVNVVVGTGVNDATNLLTLIDDSSLSLIVQIDETQVGTVKKGQSATATLDALPGQVFSGTVTSVSPVARLESNIAIFDVVITLPNPDLLLRPGMTAEAEIAVKEVAESLTVPSQALVTGPRGSSITVMTEGGSTESRPVEVIETVGFQSVVTGDFTGATQVVIPSGVAVVGQGQATGGQGATQLGLPGAAGGNFGFGGAGGGFPGGGGGGFPGGGGGFPGGGGGQR
ncbi:MAG: efflux RND transporter periplasmic adaptor subunit [Trueperaceae bacterium]|nr:efflux RND transporter periplasmic adaptor subunit [Trueperaceae bacterium]